MRRFSQAAILAHLLERDALTPGHIDQLARTTAEFHARLPAAPEGSPWGTWENVRQPAEENFEELLAAAPAGTRLQERLAQLRRWSVAALDRLRQTIVARRREGFVRECHGDLHLGNIVLLPDEDNPAAPAEKIVLFDALEFSENLRWIDVQNEIAFPTMDLQQRGRPQLAWRFLNAYLEISGDYEGLAVLPLYLNYRALVRAKVDWIRGRQRGVAGEEQIGLQAEFERYLALAESYARPSPCLFLTHGVSGSGKSFFARRLAEELGLVWIRSDVERKRLHASRDPAVLYSSEATAATYERLARLANVALAAGFAVIVDATFLARTHREHFRALAAAANAPCTLLDFRASPETLRMRIDARLETARDPSDANRDVLARQLAADVAIEKGEFTKVVTVDTEAPDAWPQVSSATRAMIQPRENSKRD
jgi:aminoglycoside phosphotransferase family enzyme/predicted kinase